MKYELPSTELIVIEENNYLKFGEYLNDMQCDDTVNKLSLDDLEYVKKLKRENKILKENAEHNDKVVDKVNWENMLLKGENKQLNGAVQTYDILLKSNVEENKRLKNNWNKLKEYIKETKLKEFEKSYGKRYGKTFTQAEVIVCNMITSKMHELEQGSDSDE